MVAVNSDAPSSFVLYSPPLMQTPYPDDSILIKPTAISGKFLRFCAVLRDCVWLDKEPVEDNSGGGGFLFQQGCV